MRGFVLGCVLAVVLGGAASAGSSLSPDDAAQFKVGVATQDDVRTTLGKPTVVSTNSDGETVLTYSATHSHIKAATFVPIVGMFAGGAKASITYLVFTFGPDGKLTKESTSSSNVDCGMLSCSN